jgi:NAD(P)-dependent dehydrogenase (short-subunit alcohol dehydrogenase family)
MKPNESIALVTGANKGIGKEIARQLAAKGVFVLLGARNETRGRQAAADLRAAGLTVEFLQLDVTDQKSVDRAASSVESDYARLDILVNNAGIALDWAKPSELTVEAMRETYDTNVFGVLRVTNAFLSLLRKSKAGRIVNVSSALGSMKLTADPHGPFQNRSMLMAYCSSKTALNMMTLQLANELRDSAIKVNAATPGYVATDMNRHQGTRTVEQGAVTPVRLALLPDDGPTGGFFSDEGAVPW